MNLEQFAFAGSIIIGLVNGIQLVFVKDWLSVAKFSVAMIAGMVFGYLGWFGLSSLEVGLAVGLASSGVYKLATKI